MSDQMQEPTYEDVSETSEPIQPEPQYVPVDGAEPVDEAFQPLTGTDLGEAGGIAFTTVTAFRKENGKNEKLEINITGRGRTAREAVDNLFDALIYAKKKGLSAWKYSAESRPAPETPVAQAPVNMSTPHPVGTNPSSAFFQPGTAPAVPSAPASAPAGQSSNQPGATGVIHATKLVVKPRTDGKTELEFWAGRQYAEIKAVLPFDRAVALLQPVGAFTIAHMQQIAAYEPMAIDVH